MQQPILYKRGGFLANLNSIAVQNTYYRRVLHTIPDHQQVVAMRLLPNENIGEEVHPDLAQSIYVIEGRATVLLENEWHSVSKGDFVTVKPGIEHDVANSSPSEDLHILVIYSRQEHSLGLLQQFKPVK